MAGITLDQAQAQLDAWLAASLAVSRGQDYTLSEGASSRRLVRADAAEIREQVKFWAAQVERLSGRRGPTLTYGVPGA